MTGRTNEHKNSASKNAKKQDLIVVRDAGTGPMQDGEQTPFSEALSGEVYVVNGGGANPNDLILFEDEMIRYDLNQQVKLVNDEANQMKHNLL